MKLVMKAVVFAESTGAALTSTFHQLFEGNRGRGPGSAPPRSTPWARRAHGPPARINRTQPNKRLRKIRAPEGGLTAPGDLGAYAGDRFCGGDGRHGAAGR